MIVRHQKYLTDMNSKKGTKEKNGSGRYTEVICDRIRSVYGCEGNSVTCKEKDDRTILSFMDVFVCINDSFRCLLNPSQMKRYVSTRGLILTIIIVSGVLWGLWFISTQVSILKRKNQELAMQVSLLNNDCEKILRELEKLKREK